MTHTIRILLTDATAGTWALKGVVVVIGCPISENRDYWKLVDAVTPQIRDRVVRATPPHYGIDDCLIQLVDPNGTDFGTPIPGGEVVCQFRVLDGQVEAQV
jgi:hypothetical protein